MEIKVNTKFDIGQEVFVCKETIKFKDGDFVDAYTPVADSYKIIGIVITYNNKGDININYSIGAVAFLFPETRVFSSFEEAEKWCNNYE